MRRALLLVSLAACGAACGGVSEARVANLEASVAQLSRGGGGDAASSDRLKGIEDQLSVLQRDLANNQVSRAAEPAPAPAPAPVAAPKSGPAGRELDAIAWYSADAALGVDSGGVSVNGDSYVIQHGWLVRELSALQLPGRAPKLLPAPGGVVIRLIKPKSMAAQLGLQNADVIVAIDDHPVASPADVSSALHAVRGGQAKVKLLRKKKEVQLDYKLVD